MATSREAQCRQYLKTLVGTIIDPDRVVLGLANFPANFGFFQNLSAEGFYAVILPATLSDFNPQDRHYKINVSIRIYFALLPDQPQDFTAIEDVVFGGIFQKVVAVSSYNGATANTNNLPPPDVPFSSDGPHVDPDLKPLPAYYELTFAWYGNTAS